MVSWEDDSNDKMIYNNKNTQFAELPNAFSWHVTRDKHQVWLAVYWIIMWMLHSLVYRGSGPFVSPIHPNAVGPPLANEPRMGVHIIQTAFRICAHFFLQFSDSSIYRIHWKCPWPMSLGWIYTLNQQQSGIQIFVLFQQSGLLWIFRHWNVCSITLGWAKNKTHCTHP